MSSKISQTELQPFSLKDVGALAFDV